MRGPQKRWKGGWKSGLGTRATGRRASRQEAKGWAHKCQVWVSARSLQRPHGASHMSAGPSEPNRLTSSPQSPRTAHRTRAGIHRSPTRPLHRITWSPLAPNPETYDTTSGRSRETVEKSERLNIYPKETESSKRNYLNRKRQKCIN